MFNNDFHNQYAKTKITNKQSKSALVYEYLVEGIITGVWKPGDQLSDKDIAETLGINRLSVRESLSRLIQDGIVEQKRWKGYYIAKISPQDVLSLVQVRVALEQLALKLLLEKPVSELQPYFLRMEEVIEHAANELDKKNYNAYMKIDFQFHELIYLASGNPIIKKFIESIQISTNIMRNISMGKNNDNIEISAKKSMYDHKLILEALKANDLTEAQELLNQHLADTFLNNVINGLN